MWQVLFANVRSAMEDGRKEHGRALRLLVDACTVRA